MSSSDVLEGQKNILFLQVSVGNFLFCFWGEWVVILLFMFPDCERKYSTMVSHLLSAASMVIEGEWKKPLAPSLVEWEAKAR